MGNAVEVLGVVAFRASPVWILAALADLCGMGRQLIPEMADALKAQGLLEGDTQFDTVDQMLDGLERTSSRLAATINAPPLDVAGLRKEWEALREDARGLTPASLPSRDAIANMWAELNAESARQETSIFQTSSVMALSATRALPDGVRWLSASARVGAARTGHVLGAALLDHYRETLNEIRQAGYLTYAARQFGPTSAPPSISSRRRGAPSPIPSSRRFAASGQPEQSGLAPDPDRIDGFRWRPASAGPLRPVLNDRERTT